jgi:hypothetical protein
MQQLSAALLTLVAVSSACLGAGGLVHRNGSWAARLAAGAIVLYLATASLGWLRLLSPVALWIVLCAAALPAVISPRRLLPDSPWTALAALLLLLPLAAMPQSARDSMNHHLYLPRLWLEAGMIQRPGWTGFFSYPYLTECLYALAGGTLGFRGSGMISLLGYVALTDALASAPSVDRRTGLIAAVIVLTIPEAFRNATWAYADSFMALFSALAFTEVAGPRRSLPRAALWAAAAACCKYNGFLVAAVVMAAVMVEGLREPRRLAAPVAVFAAMTLTWALPNAIQWGNPVHPLAGGLFGTGSGLSDRASTLLAEYSAYTASVRTPLDLAALPVTTAVAGRWDDPRLFDGAAGPLILAGTAAMALFGRGRRKLLLIPCAVLVLTVVEGLPAVRVRYLLGGLAMLALPAAQGLASLAARGRAAMLGTFALTALCAGWSGSWLVRLYAVERPWEALAPDFLERRLPYMSFYEEAGGTVGPADTTLFVNMGNRAFYFPSYVIYDETRFPLELLERIWAGMDADSIAADLRRSGIRYLAMDMSVTQVNVTEALDGAELGVWTDFAARKLVPLVSCGDYLLLELED